MIGPEFLTFFTLHYLYFLLQLIMNHLQRYSDPPEVGFGTSPDQAKI